MHIYLLNVNEDYIKHQKVNKPTIQPYLYAFELHVYVF